MSWVLAVGAGAGLGLAYFGGLWLTVVGALRQPTKAVWVPCCAMARLVLLGLALALLCRQGAGTMLAALGGIWLSRWYLLRRLGGIGDGW